MGPDEGSREWRQQVEQVKAMLGNIDAKTQEDEDAVIVLFATDASYSRSAIMTGLGAHRAARRAA